MKRAILFCSLLLCCLIIYPQAETADSLQAIGATSINKRIINSKFYQISHVGVPLIVLGGLTYHRDNNFCDMRNTYIPSFRWHYDDYLQYSPGIILLGLKVSGVEGRSSWGRMLTSDAFSAGIMALAVNSIKLTVNKERPDKSGNNSFPSGHTATAFMMATMLHKEYGTTRSPLYSILGYSLATGTAISRQLNNKHWFSDVLTGAGIGIVSTELGYYFADLIFKKKGIVRSPRSWDPISEDQPYSYLGIQMGYGIGKSEVHLPEGIEVEGLSGASSALTGGWLFNQHWGIAGKFTVSQVSATINTEPFFKKHPEAAANIESFETRPLAYTSLVGGMQYNTRIFPGFFLGGTAMAGVGWAGSYQVDIRTKGQEETSPLIYCRAYAIPNLDLSAHIMHVTGRNLGVKLFVNYNTGIGKANYSYYTPTSRAPSSPITDKSKILLHQFTIGAEVSALFWR